MKVFKTTKSIISAFMEEIIRKKVQPSVELTYIPLLLPGYSCFNAICISTPAFCISSDILACLYLNRKI